MQSRSWLLLLFVAFAEARISGFNVQATPLENTPAALAVSTSGTANVTLPSKPDWQRIEELEQQLAECTLHNSAPDPPTASLEELSYDGPIKEYRFRLRWWREFLQYGGKATPEAWKAFFQGALWPHGEKSGNNTVLV
jgi:hypothetical protein